MNKCVKCDEKTNVSIGGVFIQCNITGNMQFICQYCLPLIAEFKKDVNIHNLKLNFKENDYSHIEESLIAIFGKDTFNRCI